MYNLLIFKKRLDWVTGRVRGIPFVLRPKKSTRTQTHSDTLQCHIQLYICSNVKVKPATPRPPEVRILILELKLEIKV